MITISAAVRLLDRQGEYSIILVVWKCTLKCSYSVFSSRSIDKSLSKSGQHKCKVLDIRISNSRYSVVNSKTGACFGFSGAQENSNAHINTYTQHRAGNGHTDEDQAPFILNRDAQYHAGNSHTDKDQASLILNGDSHLIRHLPSTHSRKEENTNRQRHSNCQRDEDYYLNTHRLNDRDSDAKQICNSDADQDGYPRNVA